MARAKRPLLGLEAVLWVVAIVFCFPLFCLVNISLKAPGNTSAAYEISGPYTFDNYIKAWVDGRLGPALVNSLLIALVAVAVILVIAATAAYAIARNTGRWSRGAFYFFLVGLVVPMQLGVLPLFISVRNIGLVGSIWSLVIIWIGSGMPFAIFILATFLREAPREFEEAAAIDGAGPIRTFFSVVFPLLRPALGTVAILNLIVIWNNFFLALLYLAGSGSETVPVRINGFVREYSTDWPVIFAGLVITSLPILAAYFAMQRHIIKGFAGGLKG